MTDLAEFYKLQELLKDFIPIISRLDRNISKIDRNVDEICKDIGD